MSIASEIEDLNTNLTAAKSAVTTAGGTVGDTGLAGLATEIASIPSGGGGMPDDPVTDYGAAICYDYTEEYDSKYESGVTVNSIDQAKFGAWFEEQQQMMGLTLPLDFQYESWQGNSWTVGMALQLTAAQIRDTLGIDFTQNDFEFASFQIYKALNIGDTVKSYTLSQSEYNNFKPNPLDQNTGYITAGGKSMPGKVLKRFVFGTVPTTIPNYFASYTAIESISKIPSSITSIGSRFLSTCANFNTPVEFALPNGTDPGVTIGDYFLASSYNFNSPIMNLGRATSIDAHFLYQCSKFNQPLGTIKATSIGNYFLYQCSKFNQPVYLPNITNTASYFMNKCTAFNSPLILPEVTSLYPSFLVECQQFNQPVFEYMPKVQSISDNFMNGCWQFAQPITIPSAINSVEGTYFMYDCREFTGPIDFNNSTVNRSNNYALSVSANTYSAYTQGITIKGTQRADVMTKLPNRTSNPYRKLIDGGA